MLKIQQTFLKRYKCLVYVVFHNLEPQNAGLVDVEKDLNVKNRRKCLCAKIKKISIVIKKIIGSEDTWMHKAKRPSTCFFPTLSHILRPSR